MSFFFSVEKKKEIINDLSRVSILSMPFHRNSMLERKFAAIRYTASKASKKEMGMRNIERLQWNL